MTVKMVDGHPFDNSSANLLTPRRAAEILAVSPLTVTRWMNEAKVPFVTLPNGYRRLSRTWCRDYMDSQVVEDAV